MKTTEELNALKEEVKTMNKKLAELSEDELKQVVGGGFLPNESGGDDVIYFKCPKCGKSFAGFHQCSST